MAQCACWRLVGAIVVASFLASCASPAAIVSGDPLRLAGGSSTGSGVSGLAPGTTVTWSVDIADDASEPAVIDAYELVGLSRGLSVVGAAGMSEGPGLAPPVTGPATDFMRSAVGARSLVGWSFHPAVDGALRQWVVFLISTGSAGNYPVNSIVLRYHVGTQRFESQLPASLQLCVGATAPEAGTCPLPAASTAP